MVGPPPGAQQEASARVVHILCVQECCQIFILYVQEVVTQPKILNQTILSNLIHVT